MVDFGEIPSMPCDGVEGMYMAGATRLFAGGRIVIPAKLRRALDLQRGDRL
jgi:hypothetical protein